MGDAGQLFNNGTVDLFPSVSVDRNPEGRDSIQVTHPPDIFQVAPLPCGNDQGLLGEPVFHLSEGMPEQGFIDLLAMPNIQFSSNFLHGRIAFRLSGRLIGFKTNVVGFRVRVKMPVLSLGYVIGL